MKILALSCSPHKEGLSPRLLREAGEGAREAGADVEFLSLAEKKVKPCLACPSPPCWTALACNIKDDDGLSLREKLEECDALIISAPVYFLGINGMAKDFIDRMRSYSRKGRPALPIAAAGGTGKGCVMSLQELCRYLMILGFRPVMPMPVTRYNADLAFKEARENGRRLVLEFEEPTPFASLSESIEWIESLPYMQWDMVDELIYLSRIAIEGIERKGRRDLAEPLREELEKIEVLSQDKTALAVQLHEKTMQIFNSC